MPTEGDLSMISEGKCRIGNDDGDDVPIGCGGQINAFHSY